MTRTHLVGLAAAVSTIAIAAPVPAAGAATVAPAATPPAARQAVTVTGSTIVTTAPGVTFVNFKDQTSAGDNVSGDQIAS